MWPLIQIVLLLFTSILFHICITDPNISNADDYVPNEGLSMSLAYTYGTKIAKIHIWMMTLYQVLYLFLQTFFPSFIAILFPQISTTSVDLLPLTISTIVGFTLMIVGGLGRIWCYKTLGRFFTFKVTIRKSHHLIQTGPYAYVRHPSYTFAGLLMIGMILIHRRFLNFFPDTFLNNSIFNRLIGFVSLCWGLFTIVRRISCEEAELSKTFGNQWHQYAAKRKRFIPNVF